MCGTKKALGTAETAANQIGKRRCIWFDSTQCTPDVRDVAASLFFPAAKPNDRQKLILVNDIFAVGVGTSWLTMDCELGSS